MSKFFKIFFVLITIITVFSCVSNAETTNLYDEFENTSDSETSIDSDRDLETEDEEENITETSTAKSSSSSLASTRKFGKFNFFNIRSKSWFE